MHVMAGKVEGNQSLEKDGPAWEGRRQKDEEAGCRASIGDHVKHGSEACRLFKRASSVPIEGVEQA